MATALVITAQTNSSQTTVTITEVSGESRVGFSDAILYFSTSTAPGVVYDYTMTEPQLLAFIQDGTVDIDFLDIFGTVTIDDEWWSVTLTASADAYVSNPYYFGIYVDAKFAVYSIANSVHVPEQNKGNVQNLNYLVMWINGLGYLDTSSINDRGAKFLRRLNAITKMLGV